MGTDTDVGKTFTSMGLAAAIKQRGVDIGVCKLMMSGMEREDPKSDAYLLKKMAQDENDLKLINPFQFSERVTPYIAAKRANRTITLSDIETAWNQVAPTHDFFLVEGAGGLMAPMGQGYHVGHLAQVTNLPLVIIARAGLGTVNHTLLTIEKARALGLQIYGVIINGLRESERGIPERTNPKLIEEFSGVPVIGELPWTEANSREDFVQLIENHVNLDALL